MVGAGDALLGKDFTCERPKAPLHAIADDGVTNLLGDGEAYPYRGVGVGAVTDEQDESGRRRALYSVRGEEIRPFA
jgi:hypothetical protein